MTKINSTMWNILILLTTVWTKPPTATKIRTKAVQKHNTQLIMHILWNCQTQEKNKHYPRTINSLFWFLFTLNLGFYQEKINRARFVQKTLDCFPICNNPTKKVTLLLFDHLTSSSVVLNTKLYQRELWYHVYKVSTKDAISSSMRSLVI